jgi:putative N-acetylmannosamine-6-phosphate epimerase
VQVPVIGIIKREVPGFEVYITPEFGDAQQVAAAGAQIIALDATDRPRPGEYGFPDLVWRIHEELGLPVMADISTLDEGVAAAGAGADLVATTLSGYTSDTSDRSDGPDIELVRRLSDTIETPVVCEGRIHSPKQAEAALEAGAYAVVVGTAITAPIWITEQYVKATHRPLRR